VTVTAGHPMAVHARTSAPSRHGSFPLTRLLRWLWRLPLRWHTLGLAVVLLGVLALFPLDSALTSDEGAYALQVHALQNGSWSLDDPFAELDLPDDSYPYVNSEITANGQFMLPWSPLYVRVLQGSVALFGTNLGLHVPSVVGALLVAVAAWLVASELSTRLARPAFWIAAFSPVIVNATIVWAHATSAASAGFATWGAVRVMRRGSDRAGWISFVVGIFVTVAVRSDGLAFAAAVTLPLGCFALRRRRPALVCGVACVGVAALGTFVLQRRWSSALLGPGVGLPEGRRVGSDWLNGRATGIWNGLFRGGWTDDRAKSIGVIALVILIAGGWAAWRRSRSRHAVVASALTLALALLVVRQVVAPLDLVTGMLVAWPLLTIGIVARRWSELHHRERFLMVVCGAGALAVVASQFSGGAGLEWGGRYYSTLTVPLAVLVAGGAIALVDDLPSRVSGAERSAFLLAVIAAVVLPAVIGLRASYAGSEHHDRVVAAIEATHPEVAIATIPAVPRLAWRTVPEIAWLRANDGGLAAVLLQVTTESPGRIAVVGDPPPDIAGYRVEQERDWLWVLVLEAVSGS
jgi:hypothetical protein